MGNCKSEWHLVALYHFPESKTDHSECSMDEYSGWSGLSGSIYSAGAYDTGTHNTSPYNTCAHDTSTYNACAHHAAFILPRGLCCSPGR